MSSTRELIEQWREANDWPGLVWSPQNLSDEPRWLAAWADLESRINSALHQREQEVRAEALSIVKDAAESAAGNAFRIRDRYGDEGASEEDMEMAGCEMARKIERELNDAFSRRDDTPQEGEQ